MRREPARRRARRLHEAAGASAGAASGPGRGRPSPATALHLDPRGACRRPAACAAGAAGDRPRDRGASPASPTTGLGGGCWSWTSRRCSCRRTGSDRLFDARPRGASRRAPASSSSRTTSTRCAQITDRVTVLRDGRVVGTVVTAETERGAARRDDHRPAARGARGVEHHGPDRRRRSTSRSRPDRREHRRRLLRHCTRARCSGSPGSWAPASRRSPTFCSAPGRPRDGRLDHRAGREYDLTRMTPVDAVTAPGWRSSPRTGSDRRELGSLPVADNVMLQALDELLERACTSNRRAMSAERPSWLTRVRRPSARPAHAYRRCRGGNQQKALLAKWLPDRAARPAPPRADAGRRRRRAAADLPADPTRPPQEGCRSSARAPTTSSSRRICDRVLDLRRAGRSVQRLVGRRGDEGADHRAVLHSHGAPRNRSRRCGRGRRTEARTRNAVAAESTPARKKVRVAPPDLGRALRAARSSWALTCVIFSILRRTRS